MSLKKIDEEGLEDDDEKNAFNTSSTTPPTTPSTEHFYKPPRPSDKEREDWWYKFEEAMYRDVDDLKKKREKVLFDTTVGDSCNVDCHMVTDDKDVEKKKTKSCCNFFGYGKKSRKRKRKNMKKRKSRKKKKSRKKRKKRKSKRKRRTKRR